MTKQTITVKEAAEMIGVSTGTIYQMVRENEIPHRRVRKRVLFHTPTIEAWLSGSNVKDSVI